MASSGADLLKVFSTMDRDRSNTLSAEELLEGMGRLQMPDVTRRDAQQVLEALDANHDGRVSFFEFCARMSSCCSTRSITDWSHWAYPLIEHVRRFLFQKQVSLLSAFQISEREQAAGRKVWVDSRRFVEVLTNNVMASHFDAEIDGILQLLDVRGNQDQVDLLEFQELVGVVDYHSSGHANRSSHGHYMKNQHRGQASYEKLRKDLKAITHRLMQYRVSEGNMRMEL